MNRRRRANRGSTVWLLIRHSDCPYVAGVYAGLQAAQAHVAPQHEWTKRRPDLWHYTDDHTAQKWSVERRVVT